MAVKKYRPMLGFQDHKYHAEMEEAAEGQYVKLDDLKEVLIEWSIMASFVGKYVESPSMLNGRLLTVALRECKKYVEGLVDETIDRRV